MYIALSLLLVCTLALSGCNRESVQADAPRAASQRPSDLPTDASSKPWKRPPGPNKDIADYYLSRYSGTYAYDALLREQLIKDELKALLGERHAALEKGLSGLRSPIDVVGGAMAIYGHRNKLVAPERSVLCITFHPLRAHVGVFSGGTMTVYSDRSEYLHLPACIRQWVLFQAESDRGLGAAPSRDANGIIFKFEVVPRDSVAPPTSPLTTPSSGRPPAAAHVGRYPS